MILVLLFAVITASLVGAMSPGFVLGLKPALLPSFAVIMFFMGTLLPRSEIRAAVREPAKVVPGLLGQYCLMPLLAWLASLAFDDPMLRAGIVLLGCMPTAMASNVMTVLVEGRLSLAVFWTTTATLMAPLVVRGLLPLLIDKRVPVAANAMAWSACWVVALPVAGGIAVRAACLRMPVWWERASRFLATTSIAFIVAVTVAESGTTLLLVAPRLLIVLIVWNFVGIGLAALAGRAMAWPASEQRALVLDVAMKNAGLGALLAKHLGPVAALPSMVYAVLCLLTAATVPLFMRAPRPQDPSSSPAVGCSLN